MIYTIYKVTNKINNKVYIGFTKQDPLLRFNQHVASAYKNIGKRSPIFHKAIVKHGENNFSIETIFQSTSFEDCLIMETHFIEDHKSFIDHIECNGYNTTTGGRQAQRSKETIEKWVNDVASKPKSKEWKAKASIIRQERERLKNKTPKIPLTDEQREINIIIRNQRISVTKQGQAERGELWCQSEEGRRQSSERQMGKKQSQNQKSIVSKALAKSYLIEKPDGERIVVTGIGKAGKSLGFDQGNLINFGKTKGFILIEKEINPDDYNYKKLDFTVFQ